MFSYSEEPAGTGHTGPLPAFYPPYTGFDLLEQSGPPAPLP